jgi:uncharacterized membrane protein YcgQ (UPF0703/DUF1980 family)
MMPETRPAEQPQRKSPTRIDRQKEELEKQEQKKKKKKRRKIKINLANNNYVA